MDSFPYRDAAEAYASADREMMFRLEALLGSYHEAADRSWKEKDYRWHAIYCMAANKCAGLIKQLKKEL